eukprot:5917342-Prymnesium_polylepis.1
MSSRSWSSSSTTTLGRVLRMTAFTSVICCAEGVCTVPTTRSSRAPRRTRPTHGGSSVTAAVRAAAKQIVYIFAGDGGEDGVRVPGRFA